MHDTPHPDEPRGSCVLCHLRDPYRDAACDACRSWLAGLIGDIRILTEQVSADPDPVDDRRAVPVADRAGKAVPLLDPVIESEPAALLPGQRWSPGGGHSKPGSRPPLDLRPIDLTLPARQGSRRAYARGLLGLDPDQGGDLSVATMLQTWARDWVQVRAKGEMEPDPNVATLTRWLAARVEWACDEHPRVDEFAEELDSYRRTLRGVLGLSNRPDYKLGVACPKCEALYLVRRNGCEFIECDACAAMLSPTEYAELTGEQVRALDTPQLAA